MGVFNLIKNEMKDFKTIQDSNLETLLGIVCEYYEITKENLIAGGNKRIFVEPRQVFFYIAKTEIHAPLSKIGRFLDKHHSTVIHSIDVISAEVIYNRPLCTRVEAITKVYKDTISKEIRDFEERKKNAKKALEDLTGLIQSNQYIADGDTFNRANTILNKLKELI